VHSTDQESVSTEDCPFVDEAEFRRVWRIVTVAGLLGLTYYQAGIFGAPRTKFLLALGATPFDFGVLAGIGALTSQFQLLSGALANRLHRRKPVWMALFLAHRLLFLAVLAAPALFSTGRACILWIVGVMTVHNILTSIGDPIWFSWMSDLVPRDRMNQYWAWRQRFITSGAILTGLGIAMFFRHFEKIGAVIQGFVLLGIIGVAAGVTDIVLFTFVPEPPHHRAPTIRLGEALSEPLRDPMFRPFLLFRAYWQFAIMIAAPFFQLYLMTELGFTAVMVQLFFAVHALGIALASGFWGRLCDMFGFRPNLQLVVAVKFVVPLIYLLLPNVHSVAVPVFFVVFFLDGMVNAGGFLAMQGVALKCTPRRNRAMYIAASNFVALGLAGGLAPLISGSLMKVLTHHVSVHVGPYHFTDFHVVFVFSFLLRLGGVLMAARLREPGSRSLREVLVYIRSERPFWAAPLR